MDDGRGTVVDGRAGPDDGRAAAEERRATEAGTVRKLIVAVSGGYASLCLLVALYHRRKKTPVKPELLPVFVPDDVHGPARPVADVLRAACARLEMTLHVCPGPARNEDHWTRVPHAAALSEAALKLDAPVVALGHDIFDRAAWLFSGMVLRGVVDPLHPVEPSSRSPRFVRPLCGVTSANLQKMAKDEGIPITPRVCAHPDAELHALLEEFLKSKRGNQLEKLRNISNAAYRVNQGYLA